MDVMQLPLLPTPALLAALAARGWALAADGGRWVLTGCGDEAEFGSLDGLARWLAKQGEGDGDEPRPAAH